jgi:hypothetical protein
MGAERDAIGLTPYSGVSLGVMRIKYGDVLLYHPSTSVIL